MPAKNHTLSPDIIVLDDSDFVKPNSTGVPRKKSKTSVANESALNTSSLLFSSPQTSNSPGMLPFLKLRGECTITTSASKVTDRFYPRKELRIRVLREIQLQYMRYSIVAHFNFPSHLFATIYRPDLIGVSFL
jgi:hypothetical protein